MKLKMSVTAAPLLMLIASLSACQALPLGESRQAQLIDHADATVDSFRESDPTIDRFFEDAHAFAVFPTVTRGGVGIGGAHGRGVVFREDQPIGWCELTQATIGLQLGGQSFSQIIFFGNAYALEHFKSGAFALAANASAVAAHHGAAASADYERGVAVFTMPRGGLMFEAAVGGQRFNFEPMEWDARPSAR